MPNNSSDGSNYAYTFACHRYSTIIISFTQSHHALILLTAPCKMCRSLTSYPARTYVKKQIHDPFFAVIYSCLILDGLSHGLLSAYKIGIDSAARTYRCYSERSVARIGTNQFTLNREIYTVYNRMDCAIVCRCKGKELEMDKASFKQTRQSPQVV